MNLSEGTRRLALLLGVAGAIFGGFASYSELQTVREQRASHNRFEQLAASPVAQQARHSLEIACAENPVAPPSKTYLDDNGNPISGQPAPRVDGHTDNQCGDEQYVPMSEINSGGIKTIYWNKKDSFGKISYEAGLVQTDDGQNLFPTSEPSAWNDPLIALFPVLGFFIPWGAVRAIGWVGAGFIQGSK
jgi:hypothetical protein